jgi:hypothetical protein
LNFPARHGFELAGTLSINAPWAEITRTPLTANARAASGMKWGGAMSAEAIKPSNEKRVENAASSDSDLTHAEVQRDNTKRGIGGCLLYPLMLLIVQPILFLSMLNSVSTTSYPSKREVIWPYMIYDLLLLAAVIVLLVLFVKKSDILPAMFVLFLIIFSILSTLSANLFWRFPEARVAGRGDPMLSQMVMLFQTLLLVPYFVLDDRVRNTFVTDLAADSTLGIITRPLLPVASGLYGWLAGLGKKVYVFAIVFVIAVFMFGYAVDSIVLHGFIE